MVTTNEETHQKNRFRFAILAIGLQVVILIMYGVFVRVMAHNNKETNFVFYPVFQDVNVMMLIGFGFLMTFVKNHAWSALSYTFFINAIVVQLYPLLSGFWHRVFAKNWPQSFNIILNESTFILSSYSVASMLIAFGALLGKVGAFELLIMSVLGVIGYTLNETILFYSLGLQDVGGSISIHLFGAYFGLTVSLILSKKINPVKKVLTTSLNSTLGMIGTLFLWLFWPSFNAAMIDNPFQRSLIISNTIISLTGSCLATFIVSALGRQKFSMDDILNATLAGGVAIGAPSGVTANPGIALLIGIVSGVISAVGFNKLSEFLYHKIGLHDTCGVNNLHGIPGLLGGWISAMVIASYQTFPGLNKEYRPLLNVSPDRTFSQQAGIQVACSFISLGIAITTGIITGLVLYTIYNFHNEEFFEDKEYFQVPVDQQSMGVIPQNSFFEDSKADLNSPDKKHILPPINKSKINQINPQPSSTNFD